MSYFANLKLEGVAALPKEHQPNARREILAREGQKWHSRLITGILFRDGDALTPHLQEKTP